MDEWDFFGTRAAFDWLTDGLSCVTWAVCICTLLWWTQRIKVIKVLSSCLEKEHFLPIYCHLICSVSGHRVLLINTLTLLFTFFLSNGKNKQRIISLTFLWPSLAVSLSISYVSNTHLCCFRITNHFSQYSVKKRHLVASDFKMLQCVVSLSHLRRCVLRCTSYLEMFL